MYPDTFFKRLHRNNHSVSKQPPCNQIEPGPHSIRFEPAKHDLPSDIST